MNVFFKLKFAKLTIFSENEMGKKGFFFKREKIEERWRESTVKRMARRGRLTL